MAEKSSEKPTKSLPENSTKTKTEDLDGVSFGEVVSPTTITKRNIIFDFFHLFPQCCFYVLPNRNHRVPWKKSQSGREGGRRPLSDGIFPKSTITGKLPQEKDQIVQQ